MLRIVLLHLGILWHIHALEVCIHWDIWVDSKIVRLINRHEVVRIELVWLVVRLRRLRLERISTTESSTITTIEAVASVASKWWWWETIVRVSPALSSLTTLSSLARSLIHKSLSSNGTETIPFLLRWDDILREVVPNLIEPLE